LFLATLSSSLPYYSGAGSACGSGAGISLRSAPALRHSGA